MDETTLTTRTSATATKEVNAAPTKGATTAATTTTTTMMMIKMMMVLLLRRVLVSAALAVGAARLSVR